MSIRTKSYKQATSNRLLEEEIKMYQEELKNTPWYRFKRRKELKLGIKICKSQII